MHRTVASLGLFIALAAAAIWHGGFRARLPRMDEPGRTVTRRASLRSVDIESRSLRRSPDQSSLIMATDRNETSPSTVRPPHMAASGTRTASTAPAIDRSTSGRLRRLPTAAPLEKVGIEERDGDTALPLTAGESAAGTELLPPLPAPQGNRSRLTPTTAPAPAPQIERNGQPVNAGLDNRPRDHRPGSVSEEDEFDLLLDEGGSDLLQEENDSDSLLGDDLWTDEDDPLLSPDGEKETDEGANRETQSTSKDAASPSTEDDPHAALFAETMHPSARVCRKCHENIYEEWASSSHAYAYISPMFHKFEQAVNDLTKGTAGYFCVRCHSPVGTALGIPRDAAAWDAIPAAAREGVTCIVCHRVRERYGRVNGERRHEPGSIFEPVFGAGHGAGLSEVLAKKDHYKVKTSPDEKGPAQEIHRDVFHFDQLRTSHFCTSCHQVAVYPGIKLEVVWEQYRASPACKKGVSCQDCHMGQVPGKALGYATAPKAIVGGKPISPGSKHANHMFYGPGYSIAHPGTFPFHVDAERWTMPEWLSFDYRAGWGTKAFEELLEEKKIAVRFPKVWEEVDDRLDAREIIDANLKRLKYKKQVRRAVMENSSRIDGPMFDSPPRRGKPLRLHYLVTNLGEGHNLPTGSLGAQPQLWLNVALTDPVGQRVWESGYVDANGDMADLHSLEVAAGRIRHDDQLVNLQTKFLTTNVKGTDREMYLPINFDVDPLPFLRPSGLPITVLNHPPLIRMEAHSIPPLGERRASYRIPAECLQQPGTYRLSVRMRSRAEPIYFMRFCDATPEMERRMNEWILDYHEHAVEFTIY